MWKHGYELKVDRTVSFKGSYLTVPSQTEGLLNLDKTKPGTGGPSSLKHPPARGPKPTTFTFKTGISATCVGPIQVLQKQGKLYQSGL